MRYKITIPNGESFISDYTELGFQFTQDMLTRVFGHINIELLSEEESATPIPNHAASPNPNCLDSRFCLPHGETGEVEYDMEKIFEYIKQLESDNNAVCNFCKGTGKVLMEFIGETSCPNCYGKGFFKR